MTRTTHAVGSLISTGRSAVRTGGAGGILPILLASLTGCGAIGAKPAFTCSEKGGPTWTEVTSAHFVVKSDLDVEEARKAAVSLEAMFHSLSELGFPSESIPNVRTQVIYFRRDNEYEQMAPRMTSGLFLHGGRHDFERAPTAMLYGDFVLSRRVILQHELAHDFTHFYYPQTPVWLSEGMSVYYETLDVEGGTATIGRASNRTFWKGPWKSERRPDHWQIYIPLTEAPSATALVAMKRDDFYGDMDATLGSEKARQESRTQSIHYAAAGALVHLLLTDPAYHDAFSDYLQRMHNGEGSDVAWSGTVGALDAAKLDADYRASLSAREQQVFRTPYVVPPAGEMTTRRMPDAEVHALWAGLRPWGEAKSRAAAEADLAEARSRDPRDPSVVAMGAEWAVDQRAFAGADAPLMDALKEHPGEARLLNALGWLRLAELRSRGKVTAFEVDAALRPVAEKLAPVASTAAELDLLAHASASTSLDTALAYEKRALTVDPSCFQCLGSAAEMLGAKGLVHDALDTAVLAEGLLPDGARSPWLEALVATYRRRLSDTAAAARRGAASAAPPPAAKANAAEGATLKP